MRRFCLWVLACLCPFGCAAMADAGVRGEVPLEAVLGDRAAFATWSARFGATYRARIDAVPSVSPDGARIAWRRTQGGVELVGVEFSYPAGSTLHGRTGGGVLALPARPDRRKPLLIAIHGHEHAQWGRLPDGLFQPGPDAWPLDLARAGYAVWAPVSMHHAEIQGVAETHGYIPVWVRTISAGLDRLAAIRVPGLVHHGMAALGVSAGGQTAYALMAYRADIGSGVFAGAQQPLDFLRREYTFKHHPKCWDIEWLDSYTAIQALIAPRAIQFQLGRQDSWWPDGAPFPAHGGWFPGTSRDVLTDEIGGRVQVLRALWAMSGGVVQQHLHDGGHRMDAAAAVAFLNSQRKRMARHEQ